MSILLRNKNQKGEDRQRSLSSSLVTLHRSLLVPMITVILLLILPLPLQAFSVVNNMRKSCKIGCINNVCLFRDDSNMNININSKTMIPFRTFRLFESNNSDERITPPREEANLVNQARYLNSIETLQRLVAKANGGTYQPPENPPVYVIGRFEVPLRIDSAPGLDLTETELEDEPTNDGGGLVLVTSVTGNAAEAGLQPFDTIVGVSCKDVDPPFQVNVNSESLQNTAIALQTAVSHALRHNSTEIQLEMNRLIAGYYNPQGDDAP